MEIWSGTNTQGRCHTFKSFPLTWPGKELTLNNGASFLYGLLFIPLKRSFCPFSPPPSSDFFGMLKPDARLFTQIKEVGTHITNNVFFSVTTKDLKCLSRKLSVCLDPFPNINQYWLDLLFPKLAFYTWNQCRWRGNIPCKQFCWLSKRTFSTS